MNDKKEYFLIRQTEDGIRIYHMSKDDLLDAISPTSYESMFTKAPVFLDDLPYISKGEWFLTAGMPQRCPDNTCVIIRGEIVQPKPVKVVKHYTL